MRPRVAIVYNRPDSGRYGEMGEQAAINGVLEAVEAVENALSELEYPCFRVPLSPPLNRVRKALSEIDADLIFNLFEGFAGRPGTEAVVAAMLRDSGLPCTGCPADAIELCLDKFKVKELLAAGGIEAPRHCLFKGKTCSSFDLRFPCIVKPRAEDASHGISEESVVYDDAMLQRQADKICRLFGGEALVEEYIDGRELNATVMGGENAIALPVSEIVYRLPEHLPHILTFAAKWEERSEYYRGSTHVCPAGIDDDVKQKAADIARSVFRLCCRYGYVRVDFRQDAAGQLKVIDVNPNPDISPSSGAARQAQAAGLSYSRFIERIVHIAQEESIGAD